MEETLTLLEVAGRLKVTYRTTLRWATTGRINALRIGGRWRVAQSEFERFCKEGNYDQELEALKEEIHEQTRY